MRRGALPADDREEVVALYSSSLFFSKVCNSGYLQQVLQQEPVVDALPDGVLLSIIAACTG